MQKCSLHHGVKHVQVVFKVSSSVSLIDRQVNWRRLSRAMGTDASMNGTGCARGGARRISCVCVRANVLCCCYEKNWNSGIFYLNKQCLQFLKGRASTERLVEIFSSR